jgi:pyruvate formate lyase activating enzyme
LSNAVLAEATSIAPAAVKPAGATVSLRVGGVTRWTSIDFPGRLAAVVFCQGCPWRCGYCHNPDLLQAGATTGQDWAQVLAFLQTRVGLLDGVVFSGGEPTLQTALPAALADVRALGFETALHTGGMYPQRLAAVLPLLDWVGLDIKAPRAHYDAVTATPGSAVPVQESLHKLVESGLSYECRTTWHEDLFPVAELVALAQDLAGQGVRNWVLQAGRPGALADLSPDVVQLFMGLFPQFAQRQA